MVEYSVVMPAYNEAGGITAALTQVLGFMRSFSGYFEIIVVDDGSKDNTADIVDLYRKDHPEVKLIRNTHKGKGPAVWTGVMEAAGQYIYLCDVDLAAAPAELKKLALWITEHNFDVVIASREGVGAQRNREPFYRHLMGRVFNLIVQVLALPGIQDSQCGFKLFKANVAKDIFERLKVYGKEAKEIDKAYMGAFDVEVLYLAKKLGYKIKAVPITWTFVKTARLNPISDSIKMPLDVLKIRLNDLRGIYRS